MSGPPNRPLRNLRPRPPRNNPVPGTGVNNTPNVGTGNIGAAGAQINNGPSGGQGNATANPQLPFPGNVPVNAAFNTQTGAPLNPQAPPFNPQAGNPLHPQGINNPAGVQSSATQANPGPLLPAPVPRINGHVSTYVEFRQAFPAHETQNLTDLHWRTLRFLTRKDQNLGGIGVDDSHDFIRNRQPHKHPEDAQRLPELQKIPSSALKKDLFDTVTGSTKAIVGNCIGALRTKTRGYKQTERAKTAAQADSTTESDDDDEEEEEQQPTGSSGIATLPQTNLNPMNPPNPTNPSGDDWDEFDITPLHTGNQPQPGGIASTPPNNQPTVGGSDDVMGNARNSGNGSTFSNGNGSLDAALYSPRPFFNPALTGTFPPGQNPTAEEMMSDPRIQHMIGDDPDDARLARAMFNNGEPNSFPF